MAKFSPTVALDKILTKLTREWNEHRDVLARIEAVFSKYGIKPGAALAAPAPRIATAPAARGRKGKRGRFAQTGDEFILSLLSGGRSLSTAEINAEWKRSGRKNKADINLSKLSREKRVKREPIKGGRGSSYTA